MNKKGNVLDLLAHPTFVIVLALGFVLIGILTMINSSTDPVTFQKRFHSRNIGLLIDGIQSIPAEINLNLNYNLPLDLKVKVEPFKVVVYENNFDDGSSFYFSRNPSLAVVPTESEELKGSFVIAKKGKYVLFSNEKQVLNTIVCPESSFSISKIRLDNSTESKNLIFSYENAFSLNEGNFFLGFKNSEKDITLQINENPNSALLACYLSNEMKEAYPNLNVSVVPVNFYYASDYVKNNLQESPGIVINHPSLNIELDVIGGLRQYGYI